MVDIAKVVDYERGHPVELVHPHTGDKIGVTFWITHQDGPAVKKVLGRHVKVDRALSTLGATDETDLEGEIYLDREFEKLAACVSSWDWGKNTFNGNEVQPVTYEAALDVLKSAPWIYSQVYRASVTLENFT